MVKENKKLRIAVLQRVCTGYRTELFGKLCSEPNIDAMLFIGENVPNSKVKSSDKLEGINFRKLKTRFISLGKRVLPWQVGLVEELKKFDPDVILCEGESHFIGYLQAILFKITRKRDVALMHWCFISLPGWPAIGGRNYRSWIKKFFRNYFNAFVVYSSFSKECLIKLGQPEEKIFVATNVGEIQKFIAQSDALPDSPTEARYSIKLPERFTVLYLGTLDEVKRPDVMLDLAKECDAEKYNFVLLGSGDMIDELRKRSDRESLRNVYIPGRVVDDLPKYYRAADVLLIPGRGGIVISEAMAFGLPVIVHQADGTEYDLVRDGETGYLLKRGEVSDFKSAIEELHKSPEICSNMRINSRNLVRCNFTTDNMVSQIVKAAVYASGSQNSNVTAEKKFKKNELSRA